MSNLEQVKALLSGKTPGRKTGGGDAQFYNFPSGTDEVRFRLLPKHNRDDLPFNVVKKHYGLPESGKKGLTCATTFEMECPVCEVLQHFEDQGVNNDVLKDWAAGINGRANILVKKDPTQKVHPGQPQVARFTAGMVKWFVDLLESDSDAMMIADPFDGRDILAKREKFNGKFKINAAFSNTRIADTDEAVESILASMVDIDNFDKAPSDDDINMLRKEAEALRDVIENKVLSTTTDNGGEPDHHEQDEAPKMETRKTTTTAQRPTGTTARPAATATKTNPPPAAKAGTTLGKTPPPAKAAASVAAPKTAAKPAAAKAPAPAPQALTSNKPNGSPECYSDPGVYVEGSDKCTRCEYEFECQGAIAAGVAGEAS